MDPKPNLQPDSIEKQISENLDLKWQHDEDTLKKVLDPIASDNSHDAWELRNSFLESAKDMKKEIDEIEKKIHQLGYHKDDFGMFKKDDASSEERNTVSDFYSKRVLENRVLKLLALNLSGIVSKESLAFREKLFELGTHISYMLESLEDTYKENEEATLLYDTYFKEWAKINNVNIEDL